MNYCHPWEWKLWNAAHTSLSIFPAIPSHRVQLTVHLFVHLFARLTNFCFDRFEISYPLKSNFLMEKTVTSYFSKNDIHGVSTPLYFSPSREWTRDGREGGWFTSWKVSRENQEYYRFLQDVVMNYPEPREISPDRSPGRWL